MVMVNTDHHRGDIAGARGAILTDPPYGDGVDEAKVQISKH